MPEPTITKLISNTKTTMKKKIGFRPVGKAKAKASRGKPVNKVTLRSSLKKPPPSKASEQVERNENEETNKSTAATAKNSSDKTVPVKKVTAIRKRKHSGITVGSSRKERKASKSTSSPAIADAPQHSTSAQQDESTSGSKQSSALVVPSSRLEEQDNNFLEKLKAENPEAIRLSSFCSSFKGKKRKQDPQEQNAAVVSTKQKEKEKSNPPPKKSSQAQTGAPVVQIVDGEIVLQESSLMFPGQRRSVKEVEEEFDVVEEDAQLAIVGASYNSFVNRKGPRHWNLAETKRFFEALRQLGTDFCSMEAFFENRTRKQLKRKYTAEMTKNPKLVEMALNPRYQKNVDLSVFNVEVDDKAIEAAANEEPIPYEPTNIDPEPTEESGEKNVANVNGQAQWEVVEEDTQAEVPQPTAASVRFSAEQQTLWPSYEEDQSEAAGEFPEPSMEDFFHEQDDPEQAQMGASTESAKTRDANPSSPSKAAAEPAALSLVPNKKNTSKTRKRPKFRSAARKKK